MPRRWLHETLDLVAFGRSYWRLHKAKDAASNVLGTHHRIEKHDWYNLYGIDWTFEDPFPNAVLRENFRILRESGPDSAEEFQADLAHDLLDRCWDLLSPSERRGWAATFRSIILDSEFLRSWARIDVLQSRIEVANYNGQKTWNFEPTLKRDWLQLKKLVESKSADELA